MGYDTVSFFYDALARLVFGDAQLKAQASTLHFIKPGDSVLIVGGGSGWILDAINNIHPSGLSIIYVDSSAKMIAHAKRRNVPGAIIYHAAAIGNVQLLPGSFDVIITPFLFDNFTQKECDSAFGLLHHSLAHKGRWLFTDFQQTRRLWHKMLLRSMYLFFGLLAGINARSLPDTAGLFSMADYEILDEQKFMKGFIVSSVFEKGE